MNAERIFTPEELEKYSSAITLSDMELFVFPELLYGLVLANILSPRIWTWRDDPWFAGIEKMPPHRRVLRLKQFIMDHFEFNLDLDTWGLTTQPRELARFRGFIDARVIAESNALFGYEGDRYYFDLDIRRHFGLDKYDAEVIPYWKTETVEAMEAFRHRPGFRTGAGECVSLATLYAAALFVVCRLPLEDIFLLSTPLHSQNFIDAGAGILTNNRRVVTRAMWFNGTELSAKAQRALRHEQITMVAHCSGWMHCVYPQATIDAAAFERFRRQLRGFLRTKVTGEILANFLRQESHRQACFQLRHERNGRTLWIPAERVYAYEHGSPFKVSDRTREQLLNEIDEDEFSVERLPERLPLHTLDEFFARQEIDPEDPGQLERLREELHGCWNAKACEIVRDLVAFTRLEPHWPDAGGARAFLPSEPIALTTAMSREEVRAHLMDLRARHPVADLAWYVFRDLSVTSWAPFLKAALERNPVSMNATRSWTDAAVIEAVKALPDVSIYEGPRLAQPDEVWNFGRGDALERAVLLASLWKARHPEAPLQLTCRDGRVSLNTATRSLVEGASAKGLETHRAL